MTTLRSSLTAAICSVALVGLASVAVVAQTTAPAYNDPYCGYMQNGTWVATGNCNPVTTNIGPYAAVTGTIIFVKGHLVTLQQSDKQLVINDQPALDMQDTGRVAVGRSVEARGYWHGGTFYATQFITSP